YLAENVVVNVSAGMAVDSSTALGTLKGGCEMGWAAPSGGTAHQGCGNQWTKADDAANRYTPMGDNFNKLLQAIGAPMGKYAGPAGASPGEAPWHLCPNFPTDWEALINPAPPEEIAMSVTVIDYKHKGSPAGRFRFVEVRVENPDDDATRQF